MIAITANTSWYLYNFRKNTIKSLINSGYTVLAIAPRDEYSARLESLGCSFVDIFIDQGGKNPLKDLQTLLNFYRIFRRYPIKCVLNFTPKNNIYSTFAASFLNIKVINNIAGLGTLVWELCLLMKICPPR
ncbi:glycosyltransferase [Providencia stuartii]|uniref:glycosyltransferase n=1 Tax=Providencia stuartii TaxID=588 RepID=UPI002DB7A743|nr:glycosyltransferase [Providencia stuartii]WRV51842.1 glycosyltransferase [Providencia stuartii]